MDSDGNRTATLLIDVMVEHGERFFCTFRYKAPVCLDLSAGWHIDYTGLMSQLIDRYPSLGKRDDVVICLEDAVIVKPLTQISTRPGFKPRASKFNNNDKVRNLPRAGSSYRPAAR